MKINKKALQIAIDGPIGVGKSTLAFGLSRRLGITYIYTGVMYRAAAWLANQNHLVLNDGPAIVKMLRSLKLELKKPSRPDRYTDVYLNGKDITKHLFTKSSTIGSAQVAQQPALRQYLVKLQQQIAQSHSIIMDGRDIGTKVLPQADLKIFLEADLAVRAKRRWRQLEEIGKPMPYNEVLATVKARDDQDINRAESPLRKAADALVIDTTNLTVETTIDMVIDLLKEKQLVD